MSGTERCLNCYGKGFRACRCVPTPAAAEEVQAALREREALVAEAERLRNESSRDATTVEVVMEQAEAQEERTRCAIKTALRAVRAIHNTLPPGDVVPRQLVDALALAVEGHLLAALKGGAS